MVFSLEHDIKITKSHQNLLPTQTVLVAHTVVYRFPLPPGALPIGDTSPTHVMGLAAHSTTSPTPTAMGQSFIIC
jgi:hypothetical protein